MSPSPTPSSVLPLHENTADYGDDENDGTYGVNKLYGWPGHYIPADMKWVSLIEASTPATGDAYPSTTDVYYYMFFSGVGCCAYGYQEPYFDDLGGIKTGTPETVQPSVNFVHGCNGDLIYDYENVDWLAVDWTKPGTLAAFKQAFITPSLGHHITYWYLDAPGFHIDSWEDSITHQLEWQHPTTVGLCYNGAPITQAQYDAIAWPSIASLGLPFLTDSGTGSTSPHPGQKAAFFDSLPYIKGARSESSYLVNGIGITPVWVQQENAEIFNVNHNLVHVMQQPDYPNLPETATAQGLRMFAYSSWELTKGPKTYIWFLGPRRVRDTVTKTWTGGDPNNPTWEHIYPLEAWTMRDPVVPEPTDISQLQSQGAYFRAYQHCGYKGVYVGPCEAIVNSNNFTVPAPDQQFIGAPTLVEHNGTGSNDECTVGGNYTCLGAEIMNGGTLTWDGPGLPATIPPMTAYVAVLPGASAIADIPEYIALASPTWDYGDGGYLTPPSTYPVQDLPFMSMMQSTYGPNVYHDYSVKVQKYTDGVLAPDGFSDLQTFFNALGGVANQLQQTTPNFEHNCAGDVLASQEGAGHWFIIDMSQPAVIQAMIKYKVGGGIPWFDEMFIDGQTEFYGMEDWVHPGGSAVPCLNGVPMTVQQYMAQEAAGFQQLGVPLIITAGAVQFYTGMPALASSLAVQFDGSRAEQQYICPGAGEGGCANQDGAPAPGHTPNPINPAYSVGTGAGYSENVGHPGWSAMENNEIYMANANKYELIEEYDNHVLPTSAAGFAHREFGFDSYWLTYNPRKTEIFYGANGFIKDTDPLNPSAARMLPESLLLPLDPDIPEPVNATSLTVGGIATLKTPEGVYARTYEHCYYMGVLVGRCAFVVNADELHSHPFPASLALYAAGNTMVRHNGTGVSSQFCTVIAPPSPMPSPTPTWTAATLPNPCTGAELHDGGTVTFDGPPPPATLAPDQAVSVFLP